MHQAGDDGVVGDGGRARHFVEQPARVGEAAGPGEGGEQGVVGVCVPRLRRQVAEDLPGGGVVVGGHGVEVEEAVGEEGVEVEGGLEEEGVNGRGGVEGFGGDAEGQQRRGLLRRH